MTQTPISITSYKKINIFPQTKDKLDRLVKGSGTSLAQYVENAIDFFRRTGINPQSEFESSAKSFATIERLVRTRTDAIVAMIKEGEKRYSLPILDHIKEVIEVMVDQTLSKKPIIRDTQPIAAALQESGTTEVEEGITNKDEQIFVLERERKALEAYLMDIVNNIEVSKSNLGKISYKLNISENFYNELKTKFL